MTLTKIKSSLFKNKFLVIAFVVGFAGLGVFQVVSSSAGPATAQGLLSVSVNEANAKGVLTGNKVPNANIHVVAVPVESTYNCTQYGSPVDWGNSTGTGIGAFTCATWSGGRLYQVDASKSGYTSLGARQFTIYPGANTQVNLTLSLNDTDNDGIADTTDACPAQPGVAPSGCPVSGVAGYGVASIQVAEMNLAGQLTGKNVTDAAVTISPVPVDSTYSCVQSNSSNTAGNGNTYSYGIAAFTCGTTTGGKQYTANASKTGYVSKGAYNGVVQIGATTVLRLVLQQIDTDGDGFADVVDACPTKSGIAPNGCPPSDTTPPTAPTNLTGRAYSGGKINLSWSAATDNVGVVSYKVNLANKGTVATVTGKSVQLNGAVRGKFYTYTVIAVDAAGNQSKASNSITIKAK